MPRRDAKIQEAFYEPLKQFAIAFKKFCEDYYLTNKVPHPTDEELWMLYMEDLARKEKLHHA